MIGIGIGIKHKQPPGVSSPGFLVSEEESLYLQTENDDFIVDEETQVAESAESSSEESSSGSSSEENEPAVNTIEALSVDIFNPARAGEVGIYRPLIVDGTQVYGDKLSMGGMLYPFGSNMIFHRYNEVDAKHTYIYWDKSSPPFYWRMGSSTAEPEDVRGSGGVGYVPSSRTTTLRSDSVLYGDGVGYRPADLLSPGQSDGYTLQTVMVEPYPDGEWVMPQ